MKKNGIAFALTAFVALFSTILSGCVTGKSFATEKYFDTESIWAVYDNFSSPRKVKKADEFWADLEELFGEIEEAASPNGTFAREFDETEPGETLEISRTVYELLKISKEYHVLTEGAFNPCVGRLTELWGFDAELPSSLVPQQGEPDEEEIEKMKELTKYTTVDFREKDGKFYVKKPSETVTVNGKEVGMKLDFGGIAKGYALDRAVEKIEAAGYKCYYLNLGGSSIAVGENTDEKMGKNGKWLVKIRNPRQKTNDDAQYGEINLASTTISTSGDYVRKKIIDGKRYCHIIDCETGRPVDNGMASVSVICRSGALGDALSTALCVMGETKASEFLEKHPDVTAFFLLEEEDGLRLCGNAVGDVKIYDESVGADDGENDETP